MIGDMGCSCGCWQGKGGKPCNMWAAFSDGGGLVGQGGCGGIYLNLKR